MTLNDRRRALIMRKQSGGRLPAEYQEVEYLESHGAEHINANLTANKNTKIDIDFQYYSAAVKYGGLFGAGWGDNDDAFFMLTTGSTLAFYANFGNVVRTSIKQFETDNTRHQVQLSKDGWYADDELLGTWIDQPDFNARGSFILFGADFGAQIIRVRAKIFSCKLWQSGVLIRDFVPCYRKSDGVIGMYDLCGSVCPLTGTPFYTNAGTGAFTKGADIL